MKNTARPKALAEIRKVLRIRIVWEFGFLLRVQVVQISVELVEAMDRWQIFVAVTEMVFAELARGVTQRLE
jgi:hypothetical protein